jgi:hypothetical protein
MPSSQGQERKRRFKGMSLLRLKGLGLSDTDLDFLVETASPEIRDKQRLKQIIAEDDDFRSTFVGDEKVFRRVMDDEEIFVRISPMLFFEVLLTKALNSFKEVGYTFEKSSSMRIPIFDTDDMVAFLTKAPLLEYLAAMLSSFTKIESYRISFRVKKGGWKRIRFNDLDIHSLMSFSDIFEDEYRLSFYKRIADICLFILGMFPDFAERDYRYPFSGKLRPQIRGRKRMSPDEYEKEGRKFYKMAAEHHLAEKMELREVFWALHEDFQKAKKPLNFIAEHYLPYKKQEIFG